jgi:hypothetical protein
MAKQPVITPLGTGLPRAADINANLERIAEAFDNTLSRDGSSPNAMNADLDMNSNDILNAQDVTVNGILTVRGVDIDDLIKGVGPATVFNTVNTHTGDGVTTSYTLSKEIASRTNTFVYFDGVYQAKTNYTVDGDSLVFSTAPPVDVKVLILPM